MRWWPILVVVAAGCNQVFGLTETESAPPPDGIVIGGGDDLDLDGIPDDMDPCLAPSRDLTGDYDFDAIANADDPCPFDDATTLGTVDGDGDAVPDVCDPFPTVAGDSPRCVMRFSSTDLNDRLWHEPDALMAWSSMTNELFSSNLTEQTNVVAATAIDGTPEPTIDVAIQLNGDPGDNHAFQTWARAADPPTRDDLGCELSGNTTFTRIAIVLGDGRDLAQMTFVGDPFPLASAARMRITYEDGPDTPNLSCTVSWLAHRVTVRATAPLPPGHVGFGVIGLGVLVEGVAIYDRSALQPAP